jgi:SAM-dependent methyltransferase
MPVQLFGHVKAPSDALREMLQVLKPGGVMAAREGGNETEIVWPPLPGMLKWHKYVTVGVSDDIHFSHLLTLGPRFDSDVVIAQWWKLDRRTPTSVLGPWSRGKA